MRSQGYKVTICGQGFEENHLRNLIKKYNLSDVIDMPGYVKVSEIIPRAEIFVCVDMVDNYPSQTIAEAVSCGCALICTDVGYSRKCGSEEFSVFVQNDPKQLSAAIDVFIEKSDAEKHEIIEKARQYAIHNYSIKSSVEYFEKVMA